MPTLTQAVTALAIGRNGKNGKSGQNGKNGKSGQNGKNGKSGQAASVAGLDRTDFLLALARHGEDSFHVSFDVPAREIADG